MLSEPLLGLRGKTNSTDSAFSAASKSEDTNFAAALMQAEMKQIEYMTSEISISHKRFAFNKMVAQMESLSGKSGRKDNGRVSPTSEDTGLKRLSVCCKMTFHVSLVTYVNQ